MKRAAVLIGVKKTGNLTPLEDTVRSLDRMSEWAIKKQNFDPSMVKVISDEMGSVNIQRIYDVIEELVQESGLQQLLVYFVGHGVNQGRNEYWLLSNAPRDPNAAVNVSASACLARTVGISHVVMISDTCRTAAEGIRYQSVNGGLIFPNEDSALLRENPVDLFFACQLGSPAFEIREAQTSASTYTSIYTDELIKSLSGGYPNLVELLSMESETTGFIRPRPLGEHLAAVLSTRLAGKETLVGPLTQIPWSTITSGPEAWLARFVDQRVVRKNSKGVVVRRKPELDASNSMRTVSYGLFKAALIENAPVVDELLRTRGNVLNMSQLVNTFEITARKFGPTQLETRCGFKVCGQRFESAFALRVKTRLLGNEGDFVQVSGTPYPGANVLLTFKNGTGLILPAIPEFIGEIIFENNELLSISYVPSENSQRYHAYNLQEAQLRLLNSVVVSMTRMGVFRLEREDAPTLANKIRNAKNAFPTLALHAAYAYFEQQLGAMITDMCDIDKNDLGFQFFDIALLARSASNRNNECEYHLFPSFPLLSQGWALLPALHVNLPIQLMELQRCLVPSIWSVFDQRGTKILQSLIHEGELL